MSGVQNLYTGGSRSRWIINKTPQPITCLIRPISVMRWHHWSTEDVSVCVLLLFLLSAAMFCCRPGWRTSGFTVSSRHFWVLIDKLCQKHLWLSSLNKDISDDLESIAGCRPAVRAVGSNWWTEGFPACTINKHYIAWLPTCTFWKKKKKEEACAANICCRSQRTRGAEDHWLPLLSVFVWDPQRAWSIIRALFCESTKKKDIPH